MKTKTFTRAVAVGLIGLLPAACGDDKGNGTPSEKPFNKITFTFFVAGPLATDNTVYEVWAKTASAALASQAAGTVSLGRFRLRVDTQSGDTLMYAENGTLIANNTLSGLSVDLKDYDSLLITVESMPDADPLASPSIYLRGDIPLKRGNSIGSLNFPIPANQWGIRDSLSRFIFATPTDENPDNELSGVWFVGVERHQGLYDLPLLPSGWIYEGWAFHGSGSQRVALSTGRFADPTHADLDSSHSGPLPSLGYPGEDFLSPAPDFPITFVSGDNVAVTVEPNPDPDPLHPFPLTIFSGYDDLVPGSADFYWLDGHSELIPAAQAVFRQED